MPLSNDPERRAKQLANLRPAGAVKHGATSEGKLAPLREQHRATLLERFPWLDEYRLSLLADLLARCDLAREYLDAHGLMRNMRQPHALLEPLARWERRAWEMLRDVRPPQQQEPPERLRETIPDMLDPEVQKHGRAMLHAVADARGRRVAKPVEGK